MSDITFVEDVFEEDVLWQSEDKRTLRKINCELVGKWSRRINEKDRLVYQVNEGNITIFQCKGHYDDK